MQEVCQPRNSKLGFHVGFGLWGQREEDEMKIINKKNINFSFQFFELKITKRRRLMYFWTIN